MTTQEREDAINAAKGTGAGEKVAGFAKKLAEKTNLGGINDKPATKTPPAVQLAKSLAKKTFDYFREGAMSHNEPPPEKAEKREKEYAEAKARGQDNAAARTANIEAWQKEQDAARARGEMPPKSVSKSQKNPDDTEADARDYVDTIEAKVAAATAAKAEAPAPKPAPKAEAPKPAPKAEAPAKAAAPAPKPAPKAEEKPPAAPPKEEAKLQWGGDPSEWEEDAPENLAGYDNKKEAKEAEKADKHAREYGKKLIKASEKQKKLDDKVPEDPEAKAAANKLDDELEARKPTQKPKEKDYSKRMLSQERWEELKNGATPNTPYEYRAWVNGNPTRFRDMVAHVGGAVGNFIGTAVGGAPADETWFAKHARQFGEYKTRLAELRDTKGIELYKEGGLLALKSSDLQKRANETAAEFQQRLTSIQTDATKNIARYSLELQGSDLQKNANLLEVLKDAGIKGNELKIYEDKSGIDYDFAKEYNALTLAQQEAVSDLDKKLLLKYYGNPKEAKEYAYAQLREKGVSNPKVHQFIENWAKPIVGIGKDVAIAVASIFGASKLGVFANAGAQAAHSAGGGVDQSQVNDILRHYRKSDGTSFSDKEVALLAYIRQNDPENFNRVVSSLR